MLLDLGEAQLARGRPEDSLRTLSRVRELDPGNRRGAALWQRAREALEKQSVTRED